MIKETVAADFLESVAEKVAEKLLPKVIEHLKSQFTTKENITMDVNEAAPYIGISKEMLYKICANEGIPHVKLSSTGSGRSRLLFSSLSIDTWKREQEQINYKR